MGSWKKAVVGVVGLAVWIGGGNGAVAQGRAAGMRLDATKGIAVGGAGGVIAGAASARGILYLLRDGEAGGRVVEAVRLLPEQKRLGSVLVEAGMDRLFVVPGPAGDVVCVADGQRKFFSGLAVPQYDFDLKDCPSIGPAGAKNVLVVFQDFECSKCASLNPLLEEILRIGHGQLRVVFKPIPSGENIRGVIAARAAVGFGLTGNFSLKVMDALYGYVGSINDKAVKGLAGEIGADAERVWQEANSDVAKKMLEGARQEAREVGLMGVPALFFNGEQLLTASKEELIEAVQEKLSHKD